MLGRCPSHRLRLSSTRGPRALARALRAIRTRKALERSALWAEIGGEVRRVLEGVERGDWGDRRAAGGGCGARAGVAGRGLEHPARVPGSMISGGPSWRHRSPGPTCSCSARSTSASGVGQPERRARAGRGARHELRVRCLVPRAHRRLRRRLGRPREQRWRWRGRPSSRAIRSGGSRTSMSPRSATSSTPRRNGSARSARCWRRSACPTGRSRWRPATSTRTPRPRSAHTSWWGVLDSVDRSGVTRALVGGDFNTSTYDLSSTLALARDLLHKLLVTGFARHRRATT